MSRKQVDVTCDYCGNIFERPTNKFNEAVKYGQKQFCSKDCLSEYRNTSLKVTCATCGSDVVVKNGVYLKSISKKFFCSHSCSAKNSNVSRIVSDSQKRKTSDSLIKKYDSHVVKGLRPLIYDNNRICIICKNIFIVHGISDNRKCCSTKCGKIFQYGSLPYTREEVISKIIEWSDILGNTPSSKLVGFKLSKRAKFFFGSWNNAMKTAGLKPNTQQMSKKRLMCKDGHSADSISEMIVDNQFFMNSIKHERYKLYEIGMLNCDFYLPDYDIQVEYFGLYKEHRGYDENVDKKRLIADEKGYRLIEVLPEHLYPENRLNNLFSFLLE